MATPSPSAPTSTAAFLDLLAAGLPVSRFFAAPFVVAVSGGADSVALLLGLHALATAAGAGGRLLVAHGLHDLREDAAADAAFVSRLAADIGAACVVAPLRVRAADGGGNEGVEARARRVRYAFLAEAALGHGARHVAVAHTADDQAETILHRALRGTGVAGLAGMRRARELAPGVALVRPLLDVPRAVVREWLRGRSQRWCEDPTNADIRRARGFLRHEIIPRCVDGPYPGAAAALVRLARHAAGVADVLAGAVDVLLDGHMCRGPDGAVVLAAGRLGRLDPGLWSEIFAAVWRREGWPRRDMSAAHYARLATLAVRAVEGTAEAGPLDLPGGVRATPRMDGRIELARRP